MRRAFVVAVVTIAVSGLVPLIANAGSCDGMPCCHKSGTAIAATPGCCGPATCVKEEQALRGDSSQTHTLKPVSIMTMSAIIADSPASRSETFSESPPRPTAQRLSTLSVLLI